VPYLERLLDVLLEKGCMVIKALDVRKNAAVLQLWCVSIVLGFQQWRWGHEQRQLRVPYSVVSALFQAVGKCIGGTSSVSCECLMMESALM
jgi:hypothetical protein